MRKIAATFLISFMILFLNVACVSASKHKALEVENEQHRSELQAAKDQVADLEILVAQLERQLGVATDDQENLRASIVQMRAALEEVSARKREVEKRISEFRDLVRRFQSLTDAGQLEIKMIDGRMVVVMPSDVLFASGSASLSAEGENTLKQVGRLLASIPDKSYQIEGHTDNVPIRTSAYPSNWELAAARAIHVVKVMLQVGLEPLRMSAASFGEYKPTADNSTEEGRRANRRIEIVIVPDLSTLPGYDELHQFAKEQE